MRARPRWGAAAIALFMAAACAPIEMTIDAGAAATAIVESDQVRNEVSRTVEDIAIRARINDALFQRDVDLFGAVSLAVENGRVLLTGSVETPDDRLEATRLVWQTDGVLEVINELQVTDTTTLLDRARDLIVTKTLQSRLLFDTHVRSITYSVDTVNGTVYLFGTARSQDELDRVKSHAGNIQYVENVVSYVTVEAAP